ncbi:MAG TPA: M48 family metalloprotease [Burkholderiales bacterium]|nr:M48 family metalloprotease [Burkholderiales bacterium]
MNSRAVVAVLFFACAGAGCMVSRGPSQEQMRAQQEMMQQQMRKSTDELEVQMREMQEDMDAANHPPPPVSADAVPDEDLAKRRHEQAKAAKQQQEEMMRNLRADPETAKAMDEANRMHKEMMRANPSGVTSRFNLGDKEEAALGLEMLLALLGDQKLMDDPVLEQYLNRVGMWIAQQSERPGLPWQFAVIDSDSVNAFAVPGGYVFVTRGMLALLESESELAGVLGHEISHVVRKHHLRWIYMNKDMQASSARTKATIRKYNPAMLAEFDRMDRLMGQQMALMNSGAVRANLSRSEEMQADSDGATLAWRAGYESWGMVSALQRFEAWQRPRYAALRGQLTDHPEPIQRLKMLDLTLRSRTDEEMAGDVGGERYLVATRAIRGSEN